jgi:hypothetical protein
MTGLGLIALILIVPPWYHLGRWLVDKLTIRVDGQSGIDKDLRDGLSIGIGFTVLSYVVMGLGLVGLLGSLNISIYHYRYAFLRILAILPFIVTLPLTIRRARGLAGRIKDWKSEFHVRGDKVLWAILGVLAIAYLISAGNVVVGWDAAVQHYAFPRDLLWFHLGRLDNAPEIPFSYYPALVEMLFTLALGTGGVFTAGAMTWVYLFPLAAAMLAVGRRLGSGRLGLWSFVLFLGAPLTFELPFSGVVDLPFLVYCALALAVLLETDEEPSRGRIILIGLLIGCASATKHLGLLYLIAFLPVMVWRFAPLYRSTSRAIMSGIAVAGLTLLVPLPWYIRSYHYTGDPVFPFLSHLTSQIGGTMGSFSMESFARTDYPRNIFGYLGYLWHLTMDYWDLRPWFLAVNPAYLASIPIAIVWAIFPMSGTGKSPALTVLRQVVVLGMLTLTINFFMAPAYPRYLFPTWVCFSIIAGWVLINFQNRWQSAGRIFVAIALVLPLMIVVGQGAKRVIDVTPQYFSREARLQALREGVPGWDTFDWANHHKANDRSFITHVLSTDPKVYYFNVNAIIGKPGIESSLLVPWDSDPSEIVANWHELNITHFLLDTTLLSVKHGFGIAYFTDILGSRDKVWLDIKSTRAGAEVYGIGDILTDDEFLHMSELAQLPIVNDGTIDRHLFTREDAVKFQSWGRDWQMAHTVLLFINAGILKEEFRSGPGGGIRIYSVHYPEGYKMSLPPLPDVTGYCLRYEQGPVQ